MSNVDLKSIYSEIIAGYSSFSYNNKICYIKHLTSIDASDIDLKKQQYHEYFLSKGAISYDIKLKEIIDKKLWSLEKDREIEDVKSFILSLENTKSQYTLQKDKKLIDIEIKKYKERLFNLIIEKHNLMGKTAEDFTNKKINEYYVLISLYSNRGFKSNIYTEEQFDELDQKELDQIVKIYNNKLSIFNDINLKKIALMPYFINMLILSNENPYYLFGKPIIELTFYQIDLVQYGKTFKNILQNSKIQPPPELLNNPDKLIEWFDSSQSAEKMINNPNNGESDDKNIVVGGDSIVGATSSDYKNLGVEDNVLNNKLNQELKKKGELGIMDLLKIHDIKV